MAGPSNFPLSREAPSKPPPTRELGARAQVPWGGGGWTAFLDEDERTPELAFPTSIETFHAMRSDSQVDALHIGTVSPIKEFRWSIDPNGCRARLAANAATDLGLPLVGKEDDPIARSRNGFDFDTFLGDALLAPLYGFFDFEYYGTQEEGKEWRLSKVAPRHPRLTGDFKEAANGDLEAIRQRISGASGPLGRPPEIPVWQLIRFVWRPEAGSHVGRALDPETPIPTPDGWRTMGELQVGDRVFDETGAIRHVTARADWQDRPCYEVEFNSGEVIVADAEHQWLTHHYKQRHLGGEPELVTTREMAETVEKYGGRSNHAMPMAGPLGYVRQHLLVDPYVLGFWLGDGTSTCAEITTMDAEVVIECERRGHPATKRKPSPSHVPTRADHYALGGGLQERLRVLGLLRNKHVPEQYLKGDGEQRLDLLRGLMDSDGNVGGKNGQRAEFTNTNRSLAEAVLELARGLGGRGSIQYVERGVEMVKGKATLLKPVWKVAFHVDALVPFLLARKAERYRQKPTKPLRHHYVRAVRQTTARDTVCIEVDSPSHLFLAGRSLVATHNSMLRSMYREWRVKEKVVRIAAINLQRAGGVPVVEGAQGMSDNQIKDLAAFARQFKVAEGGGGAIPFGTKLQLVGGSVPDAVSFLKYLDECMARVWALMLVQLGMTSTGNRALGAEFAIYAARAQRSWAKWVCSSVNRFLDRYVEWNDPFETHAPLLRFQQDKPDALSVTDLVALVSEGIITVDPELEEWMRSETGLPAKPEEPEGAEPEEDKAVAPSPTLDPTSQAPTIAKGAYPSGVERIYNGVRASLTLPAREMSRPPSPSEIRAAVDFRGMDTAHGKVVTTLQQRWLRDVLPAQIKAMGQQIRDLPSLSRTSVLDVSAPVLGADLLMEHLTDAAVSGADAARREMIAQGKSPAHAQLVPGAEALARRVGDQAGALARLNANAVALAAQRKAASLISTGGRDREQVAATVEDHLKEMKHVWEREQLKGAVTMAQNQGRIAAFESQPDAEQATYEASELLDERTCEPCEAIDGHTFDSLDEASEAYAGGGYTDCEGGPNCRGTLVAIFPEQNPAAGEGSLAEAEPAYL